MLTRFHHLLIATGFLISLPAFLHAGTFTPNVFDDPPPMAAPNGCNSPSINGGRCSLREAVLAANANADADEIVLSEGIYQLARPGTDDTAENGDLDFTQASSSISIVGQGPDKTVIDAALQSDRIFQVTANFMSLSVSGTTLRNGNAGSENGGAIGIGGVGNIEVNLTDCRFEGNRAAQGGAVEIKNASDGTFSNVVFSDNRATDSNSFRGGGGLRVGESSTLTWENGVVTGNQSASDGGGLFFVNGARVTMSQVDVLDNESQARGGGIFTGGGAELDFAEGRVLNNRADEGGGMYLTQGGGSVSEFNRLTISDNEASGDGGGIWTGSSLQSALDNSTVSGNTSGGDGGGIFGMFNPTVSLNNSTISGNSAAGSGGAFSGETDATFNIRSTTIFDNSAQSSAGGIFSRDIDLTVTIANSILAGNTAGGSFSDCDGVPVGSGLTFTSGNYNLFGDVGDCAVTTLANDQTGVDDPGLNPLADNGGDTPTHLPHGDSPAVDGGNPGGCLSTGGVLLTQDQRGQTRPLGAACDVGSVELGSSDLGVTKTADATTVSLGDDVVFTITVTNHGPDDNLGVRVSDTLPAGLTLVTAIPDQGSCAVSGNSADCSLSTLVNGASVTVEIVATAAVEGAHTNTATVQGSEDDPDPDNNNASVSIEVPRDKGGGCRLTAAPGFPGLVGWGLLALGLATAGLLRRLAGLRR